MVEELKFLEQTIPGLKQELLAYLATAEEVSNIELLEWWMRPKENFHIGLQHVGKYFFASHLQQLLKEFSVLSTTLSPMIRTGLLRTTYTELSLMLQKRNHAFFVILVINCNSAIMLALCFIRGRLDYAQNYVC